MPACATFSTTDDQAIWDGVVDRFDGSTGFHRWDHLDLTERLFGVRVDRLLVSVDGIPVGVWPVPRRRFLVTASLPFPFLGPLVPEAWLAATITAFRRRQWRHGLIAADFDLLPGSTAETVAGVSGIRAVQDATIVVDHTDVQQLAAGYTKMRRKSLRRAEAAGVTVRSSLPGELTSLLHQVLEEAYGGRGVASPYPDTTGAFLEQWVLDHPSVHAITALVGDELAGILVYLDGGAVTLGWLGGCLRRFRDQGPNVSLYHEQLVRSAESGATRTDMIGSVDAGVTAFKVAFGGVVTPYVRIRSRLGPSAAWDLIHTLRRAGRRTEPDVIPAESPTPAPEPALSTV